MSTNSSIEWTEVTWNPVTGCDRVAAGCDNCYALALAKRLKAMGAPKYQNDGDPRTSGPGFGVTIHPARPDAAARVADAEGRLRELDERPVPRQGPDRASSRDVFDVIARDPAAHLPGPHEASASAWRGSPTSSTGPTTSGWASPSRPSTPSTESTTCAPSRPRCGSCPASRCSAALAGHRPRRHRLGDRRRRVRSTSPAAWIRDWALDIRDQCVAAGVRVLLQAVGRPHPEGERPPPRGAHLGRDAEGGSYGLTSPVGLNKAWCNLSPGRRVRRRSLTISFMTRLTVDSVVVP